LFEYVNPQLTIQSKKCYKNSSNSIANPYRPQNVYIQNKTTKLLISHIIKKTYNANPIQSTTQHPHCQHQLLLKSFLEILQQDHPENHNHKSSQSPYP
jgi:hypothetical protein